MRTFEILTSIALVPAMIGLSFRRGRRARWLRLSAWVAMAMLLLHLLIEGYRWQMIPAYLVVVWGCGRTRGKDPAEGSRWRTAGHVAGTALMLAAYATALFLGVKIPVFDDPAPTGPYAVGTTRLHFVDGSREDPFAPHPGMPRELLVVAWYPAEVAPGIEREQFWPDAPTTIPVVAQAYHLPPLNFLQHLRLVRTHSYPGAPVARGQVRYPVLIFSHGYASAPWQNTVQMEELASHGFLVFSIGHAYESAALAFPDGRVVPWNRGRIEAASNDRSESRALARESLGVWVADTRYVLDQLTKIDAGVAMGATQTGNRFRGRLDLGRLGVFGMSFGGATAGEFCLEDPRCKAGINLDGWQSGDVAEHPLSVPFLYFAHEGNEDNDPIYAKSRGDLYRVQVRHSAHGDFTDAGLIVPILKDVGLLGSIDAMEMERILNAYTLAFFQKYLEGKPAPLLDGPPSGLYSEVVFTRKVPMRERSASEHPEP